MWTYTINSLQPSQYDSSRLMIIATLTNGTDQIVNTYYTAVRADLVPDDLYALVQPDTDAYNKAEAIANALLEQIDVQPAPDPS